MGISLSSALDQAMHKLVYSVAALCGLNAHINNCLVQRPYGIEADNIMQWLNCPFNVQSECGKNLQCKIVCEEGPAVPEPPKPVKPTIEDICSKAIVDLTFVVDGSGSVNETNFELQKNFLKAVVDPIVMGIYTSNAGIIKFSDLIVRETDGYLYSKMAFNQAVDNMVYERGFTYTGGALREAKELLEVSRIEQGVDQIMVVMTDGESNGNLPVKGVADDIHSMGVMVIAIGIGNNANIDELNTIASEPRFVYDNVSFEGLKDIQEMIAAEICKSV